MQGPDASAKMDRGRAMIPHAIVLAALLLLAQILAPAKASAEVVIHRLSIGAPVLTDARGVVGMKHSYKISSGWDLSTMRFDDNMSFMKNSKVDARGWMKYFPNSYTTLKSGLYFGSARWDRKTGEFVEDVDLIEGTDPSQAKQRYFGTRIVKGKCSADPFLGPAMCHSITLQWDIPSWGGKPGPLGNALAFDQMRKDVVAWRSIDLAMAQALSQMHKDEPGYQPPATAGTEPEKPTGTSVGVQSPGSGGTVVQTTPATGVVAISGARQPGADKIGQPTGELQATSGVAAAASAQQTSPQSQPRVIGSLARSGPVVGAEQQSPQPALVAFEAEQLLQSGKASATAGNLVVQPMEGFGPGWSGNAQLFWSGGAPGAALDLTFEVAASGAYAVEIQWTRAPDYADLSAEVDGVASPLLLMGYAPSVLVGPPTRIGEFSFQPGLHKVRLTIAGKGREATNYFAGIDRVLLTPMP